MLTASEADRVCFVLVNTRNPLNLGAAARALSNFGFLHLRVVNPYDPSFREARSAVGAAKLLLTAQIYKSVAEAVADFSLVVGTTAAHNRDLQHPLRVLPDVGQEIRRHLQSNRVAVLFGSERVGLSNEDLSHCHWLLRVPTREEHGSMNLGQAVAVTAYEISRSENKDAPPPLITAAADDLERLASILLETLDTSGYLNPATAVGAQQKMRRLVHRLNIPAEDIETWMGILRQMLWKLKAGTK